MFRLLIFIFIFVFKKKVSQIYTGCAITLIKKQNSFLFKSALNNILFVLLADMTIYTDINRCGCSIVQKQAFSVTNFIVEIVSLD